MAEITKAFNGYTNDWYPPIEPVIPRVYHEYAPESLLEHVYTEEQLDRDDAYFTAQPDTYKVHNYAGAAAKLVQTPIQKALLLPGSKTENQVANLVYVKNMGYKPIFVRIHLAIPAALDDADPTFDARSNMLHFNANPETGLATGAFSWSKKANDGRAAGAFIGSSGWNFYNINLDGIKYNVYVATLETALESGKTSPDVINQCYLDAKATKEDLKKVFDMIKTNKWDIRVAVEAVVDINAVGDPFELFDSISPVGAHDLFTTDFVADVEKIVPPNEEEPKEEVTE